MTDINRTFTVARRTQGFTSQAHLDAFYAYYDHTQACPACQVTTFVPFEDGVQPARAQCAVGIALFVASDVTNFPAPVTFRLLLTAVEVKRWLAQLGVAIALPRAGRVVLVEQPGPLGGIWKLSRVPRGYTVETVR